MKKAIIELSTQGTGFANKVEIDGKELGNLTQAINISCTTGDIPRITLDMFMFEGEITIEGEIYINAIPVDDYIGRKIYESLKGKYEEKG